MNSKAPINDFVCKNLRRIRLGKAIKVMDVSQKTGIPASSYSCLEWGRYKLSLDNLFRILQALDARITDVWPMAARRPEEGVTTQHIAEVLKLSERMRPPEVSIDKFVEAVCQVCKVESIDRRAARSSKQLREVQVIAAIICRDIPQITLTALSHKLDVNISSLSHRTRRTADQARSDEELNRRIESIRREVLTRLPNPVLAKAS